VTADFKMACNTLRLGKCVGLGYIKLVVLCYIVQVNKSLPSARILLCIRFFYVGRDSSVGKVTDYGLDGPGDRIPVGTRFFAHVQTGPGVHPASCTMGTLSFPGVKRPGRGAGHPPPSSAPRSRKDRVIPLSTLYAHSGL
jgi:hypothetical protein